MDGARLAVLMLAAAALAQDAPLAARLEAEAAFRAELAEELSVDFAAIALGEAAEVLEHFGGVTIEVPATEQDAEVSLRIAGLGLWTVAEVLARQVGLDVYADIEGHCLRLGSPEEVAAWRLEATFPDATLGVLRTVPEGLPAAPPQLEELAGGRYRLALGDGAVGLGTEEGPAVVVDAQGAVLLDQAWQPHVEERDQRLLERLEKRTISVSLEGDFASRIALLRDLSGLPLVVTNAALGVAGDTDAPPLILTDVKLRLALEHLTGQYGLAYAVRDGVLVIGTRLELRERQLGLRCLDSDGAACWDLALRLPGDARLRGLRALADVVTVYIRSEGEDVVHIVSRSDGSLFERVRLGSDE